MWLFGSAKVITQINTTILLLHRVLNNQTQLQKELNHMSQELDALTAEVANVKTVEASAVALIESLAAKITAAGTDPVAQIGRAHV